MNFPLPQFIRGLDGANGFSQNAQVTYELGSFSYRARKGRATHPGFHNLHQCQNHPKIPLHCPHWGSWWNKSQRVCWFSESPSGHLLGRSLHSYLQTFSGKFLEPKDKCTISKKMLYQLFGTLQLMTK